MRASTAKLSEFFLSAGGSYIVAIGVGVFVQGRPPVQLPVAIATHVDYNDALVMGAAHF